MGELHVTGLVAMPRYQPYYLVELSCGDVVEVHDHYPGDLVWKRCPGCGTLCAPVDWVAVGRG